MKRVIVVLLLFLLFSSLLIISNNDIHLFEKGGLASFGNAYLSWIALVSSNLFSITGNFIQSNNSSNSTQKLEGL